MDEATLADELQASRDRARSWIDPTRTRENSLNCRGFSDRVSVLSVRDASVGGIKLHLGAAKRLGLNPAEHLRSAGIDPSELDEPDARIELYRAVALIESIAAAAPVTSYGLWLGEHFHPSQIGVVGHLLMSASTVREALALYCRYQRIVGGAFDWRLHPAEHGQCLLEMREMRLTPIAVLAQEWSPAAVVATVRTLSGDPVTPVRAEFEHSAPPYQAAYTAVFGCPLHFEAGRTALVFRDADLEKPAIYGDPSLAAQFEQICKHVLARLDVDSPVSNQVLGVLLKQMAGEEPSITTVAKQLAMSTRSVQARLQEEGTNYKDLLAQARRRLAEQHLRNPSMSIAEVSFLVGFSEPSAFHRAFKRWTGSTPATFRAHASN